ncbi:MAG: thioredoxin family protein [Chitinophagaceae bacterium]|jgi:thiol:disulfide interchange protein DsbD
MKHFSKFILLVALFLLGSNLSHAQLEQDPSTWTYDIKKGQGDEYTINFHVKLKEHWHIYSLNPGGDGSLISPSFEIKSPKSAKLKGKPSEKGTRVTETEETIGTFYYFKDKVDYSIKAIIKENGKLTGYYGYQVCDESHCLPPFRKQFSFNITDAAVDTTTATASKDTAAGVVAPADTVKKETTLTTVSSTTEPTKDNNVPKDNDVPKSIWVILLSGLGAGLAAVVTPCIYSMIPITVSFFTKKSKTRREGIINASFYSFSIIFIFAALGMLIVAAFGANALNTLSTHWIPNLFFFAIFLLFAFSFLGAFELTLPSSWTNKVDSKANTNSFTGIFFMALTLVIVSFSCTSAFIGGIAVLASKGGVWGPLVGFASFGLGIALPFTIFALFPSYLKNLEKPGGWQNAVKVTLGFLELALALKFLSNADLAKGWRLLDREIFIAIWVVLAILLGLYLLGKLRFSHDDDLPKNMFGVPFVSIPRLLLAISAFSFAVYMIPGMWGAPLKAISSFVPPMGTQDFTSNGGGGTHTAAGNTTNGVQPPMKYADKLKIYEPEIATKYGLVTYYDLDEAKAASTLLKKPLMLDFTGINCINCRKMEGQVWSHPEVMKRLKEDFVVVSLYCDYNNELLPESEQYDSKILGSRVETVGNKNADYQATQFNTNAQPFYFFIDEQDRKLAEEGYDYNPDVSKFIAHLDAVKAKYKELHP